MYRSDGPAARLGPDVGYTGISGVAMFTRADEPTQAPTLTVCAGLSATQAISSCRLTVLSKISPGPYGEVWLRTVRLRMVMTWLVAQVPGSMSAMLRCLLGSVQARYV